MSNKKIIVGGYGAAVIASLQKLYPPNTVILVEEPDVIRKRDVVNEIKKYPVVQELISFEYQRDQSADAFFARVKHFDVGSVIPSVEYATPFVARLAERFNIPGASYGASLIMRDKNKIRAVTHAHGIKNPQSQIVASFEDVVRFAEQHAGSIIIKPANRQGSVGAVIVHDKSKLREAWDASRVRDEGAMVPDRNIDEITLVEQFITGQEFSVEALVKNGQIIFSNVTMKELFEGVNPVECAHTVPAPISAEVTKHLVRQTQMVIESTGFHTGVVHCEWMLAGDDAYLVECAGRFAGDGIIDLIERAYAFELVASYHRLMRGEVLFNLPTQPIKTAMVRFLGGKEGVISAIELDETALKQEGVAYHTVLVKVGEKTYLPSMSWHRLGSVVVEAPNAIAAKDVAERALAGIGISYETA